MGKNKYMIPWKQNCPHSSDGWCLTCISNLGDAIRDYLDDNDFISSEKREKVENALANNYGSNHNQLQKSKDA